MDSFVVISASLSSLDSYQNHIRTCELRQELLDLGVPFDGLTQTKDGKTEAAFLVMTKGFKPYLSLAQKFGQKSILFRDKNSNCFEVTTGKKSQKNNLGTIISVTEVQAKSVNHSFCVQDVSSLRYFSLSLSVN